MKKYQLIDLPNIIDERGNLTVAEFGKLILFEAKRFFMVYQVPLIQIRGEHAHHKCHQFLIAARGSIAVIADDGVNRDEFLLNRPNLGLYLPPLVWGVQYKYSPDACLLVFASDYYDGEDYIRNYDDFLKIVGSNHD
jgi:UDP-2-acetamido-3-amino-2,3-dideoxy-glucuronate N-acetyltransferase